MTHVGGTAGLVLPCLLKEPIVMTLLRNLIAAIRGLIERIRPEEVPDGNPEYL